MELWILNGVTSILPFKKILSSCATLKHVALHPQAFSHPISSNHPHPVERLAREVQQLKDKLAQVSVGTDSHPPTKTAEPRRSDTNLNQNTNNGTFLFPGPRPPITAMPRVAPRPTSANHQSSRGPPLSSVPPSRPAHKDSSGSNKHTFLFGNSSVTEARHDQRYYPAPNNAKLPKCNGSSVAFWGLVSDMMQTTPPCDQVPGVGGWGTQKCLLSHHIWLIAGR